jgi:hypothetical protein
MNTSRSIADNKKDPDVISEQKKANETENDQRKRKATIYLLESSDEEPQGATAIAGKRSRAKIVNRESKNKDSAASIDAPKSKLEEEVTVSPIPLQQRFTHHRYAVPSQSISNQSRMCTGIAEPFYGSQGHDESGNRFAPLNNAASASQAQAMELIQSQLRELYLQLHHTQESQIALLHDRLHRQDNHVMMLQHEMQRLQHTLRQLLYSHDQSLRQQQQLQRAVGSLQTASVQAWKFCSKLLEKIQPKDTRKDRDDLA